MENNNGLPEYQAMPNQGADPQQMGREESNTGSGQNMENSNGYNYGQQTQPGQYQQTRQTVPPQYTPKNTGEDTSVYSVKQWLITMLLGMIPLVGIVLYIVWAVSSDGNVNRKNFCKAQLLVIAILFALYILFVLFMVFVGIFAISASYV